MKKTTTFGFIIILFIVLIAMAYLLPQGFTEADNTELYNKILEYDLENNYPQSPADVVSINNQILSYFYGGAASEDTLEPIVLKQRQLLDQEVLDMNPVDSHVRSLAADVKNYRDNEYSLISSTQGAPVYDEFNPSLCQIKVTSYYNNNSNDSVDYHLRRDDNGRWKIFSFEPSDINEIAEDSDEE